MLAIYVAHQHGIRTHIAAANEADARSILLGPEPDHADLTIQRVPDTERINITFTVLSDIIDIVRKIPTAEAVDDAGYTISIPACDLAAAANGPMILTEN